MTQFSHIYFIGIGGIGMSALARYFNVIGKKVAGYDKTETTLTQHLIAENISVHYVDDISKVDSSFLHPEKTLIVYTPAIPDDSKELLYFRKNNYHLKKRAEVLGMITENGHTVAVAGTHGKTTTSSLIAHILKTAGKDPSAFLGGITQNYKTNLLISENVKRTGLDAGQREMVVVEADEYDRSFLSLHPQMAVITSMDADHLDIYGDSESVKESFRLFAKQVDSILIIKKSIASEIEVGAQVYTYSITEDADFKAMNISIADGFYRFSVKTPSGLIIDLEMGLPGKHNVENAVAATAIAYCMGISEQNIRIALRTFLGVKRRFEYHINFFDTIFIDDYAHHPEELKATINSVKEMYPGRKITGVFQPHLYSRTRDFADDFAKSLDLLNECLLLDIYPAREQPIEGVSSQMLIDRMTLANKKICSKEELLRTLALNRPQILLTMGAGDIDKLIDPIKEILSAKKH